MKWIPDNLQSSVCNVPPVSPPGVETSATFMANNSAIGGSVIRRVLTQATAMLSRGAFIHSYYSEGLEQDELHEALNLTHDLVAEYQQYDCDGLREVSDSKVSGTVAGGGVRTTLPFASLASSPSTTSTTADDEDDGNEEEEKKKKDEDENEEEEEDAATDAAERGAPDVSFVFPRPDDDDFLGERESDDGYEEDREDEEEDEDEDVDKRRAEEESAVAEDEAQKKPNKGKEKSKEEGKDDGGGGAAGTGAWNAWSGVQTRQRVKNEDDDKNDDDNANASV